LTGSSRPTTQEIAVDVDAIPREMRGHITISILCGNTAYCAKLSGEDLSRYSKKIESLGLKMSVLSLSYQESDVTITNISQSLPRIMAGKQLG